MSQVRVLRNSSGGTKDKEKRRKKMTIQPVGGEWKIIVPYAPREVSHSNLSPEWEEVPRVARKPFLARSNDPLPRMSFTLLFGDEDPDKRFDDELRKLERIADGDKPVRVNYSTWETGSWRISSLSFRSVLRHRRNNEITRAEVDIEFVESVDIKKHVGPLSGGVKKPKGGKKKDDRDKKAGRKPKKGGGRPRRYKVKRGDTLSEIAVRFYRDYGMWRKIADKNNIRNPRKLPIGKVLRLP